MFSSYSQHGAIVSTGLNSALIGYGERVWSQSPDNSKAPWFYFPDFFLRDRISWFKHQNHEEILVSDLIENISDAKVQEPASWQCNGEEHYSKEFANLKQSFKRGLLKKAVPYIFYTTQGQVQIQRTLSCLLEHALKHPTYLYGFWSNEGGILGGTPELLFTIDESSQLTTAAMAGTTIPEEEERLLTDPKLVEEHTLVIEGIIQSLRTFGSVHVGKTEILSLAKLSHAKTPITVKLSHEPDIDAIVNALHPTPALGAYPKDAGRQWLQDYHQLIPRGRYGAPVGVKMGNQFHCYVAIRNMQWDQNELRIGVGGGIVERSHQSEEMNELALKFQATRTMLGV